MAEQFKITPQMKKTQLIDEHQRLLEAYRDKAREVAEARSEVERATADAAALKSAREATVEGVIESLGQLRGQVGKTLNDLTDRMSGQAERLENLNRAVAAQERRLEELRDIDAATATLADVVAAYEERRQTAEAEYSAQVADLEVRFRQRAGELEAEIQERRAAWTVEREQAEGEAVLHSEQRDRDRAREEEEYGYQRDRERKLETDRYEDAKNQRERELAEKLVAQERKLDERKTALAAREKDLEGLLRQVETFPAKLEEERSSAAAAAREAALAEIQHEKSLAEAERTWETKLLNERITHLQGELEARDSKLTEVKVDLDAAMRQVQQLAERALGRGLVSMPRSDRPGHPPDSSEG